MYSHHWGLGYYRDVKIHVLSDACTRISLYVNEYIHISVQTSNGITGLKYMSSMIALFERT